MTVYDFRNKFLDEYINENKTQKVKTMSEWKEAKSGDVIKFENEGDSLEGIYQGFEESTQYPGSYAIKVKKGEDIKVGFTSKIVTDLLKSNGINIGQEIKIIYTGMQTTKDGSKEYKSYSLQYK